MCLQTKIETGNWKLCVDIFTIYMLDGEHSLYMIFNQELNKTGGENDDEKTKWKTMKQFYNSLLLLQGENDNSIHSFRSA